MGNNQGGSGGKKLAKKPPSADSGAKTAQDNAAYAKLKGRTATQLLDEDDTRRLLKQFAKSRAADHPELASQIDFLEAVNKRYAVYASGIRCGDDKSECQDRAEETGNTILETYVQDGAPKLVTLPADLKQSLLDLGEAIRESSAFYKAEAWLEAQISEVLQTL